MCKLLQTSPPGIVVVPRPDVVTYKVNQTRPTGYDDNALRPDGPWVPPQDDPGAQPDHFLVANRYNPTSFVTNRTTFKFGMGAAVMDIGFRTMAHELAYGLNSYRLQGNTLPKLIVDLNQRPRGIKAMQLPDLYVIISRVTKLADLRIMPFREHASKEIKKSTWLNYLLKLTPRAEYVTWHALYDAEGHARITRPQGAKE